MTGARMELTGNEEALAALAGYVARMDHPKPMFANIGMSLVTSTQRRFEQGKGPDGSPWPPSIRALATGGKTLVDKTHLMNSQTYNASDAGVEVGTNKIYAAIHQLGGIINQAARKQTIYFDIDKRTGEVGNRFIKKRRAERRGGFAQEVEIGARTIKMPARPFLGIDDDDESEILKIAEEFVGGAEAKP